MDKVIKIETLNIHLSSELTQEEYVYFKALNNLISSFKAIDKNSELNLYLSKSTYLLGLHTIGDIPDPLVFVNSKGEIMYDVEKEQFSSAIKEFSVKYLLDTQTRHPELTYERAALKAIDDYKNDKLDFYTNSKVIGRELSIKAKDIYDNMNR